LEPQLGRFGSLEKAKISGEFLTEKSWVKSSTPTGSLFGSGEVETSIGNRSEPLATNAELGMFPSLYRCSRHGAKGLNLGMLGTDIRPTAVDLQNAARNPRFHGSLRA